MRNDIPEDAWEPEVVIPTNITTRNGLLFQDEKLIALPAADKLAQDYGFVYAEELVKHLAGEGGT